MQKIIDIGAFPTVILMIKDPTSRLNETLRSNLYHLYNLKNVKNTPMEECFRKVAVAFSSTTGEVEFCQA